MFWVTYGDTLLDVDLAAAEAAFDTSGCRALMTGAPQSRRSGNRATRSSTRGHVVDYGKSPPPAGAEHIDYGMLLFQRSSWDCRDAEEVFDLADVLRPLIRSRDVAAFEVTARFHDIGTPEAVRETEAFLSRTPPGTR